MPNLNKMNVKRRTPFRMEIERGHDMDALRFIMDRLSSSFIYTQQQQQQKCFRVLHITRRTIKL